MPYIDLPDCKLFYTIDDHTDPGGTARVTLDFLARHSSKG